MKYLKISLFVLAILFIFYWLVQIGLAIWDKSAKTAVWSLIPADAVAVWQIPNANETYHNFDSTSIWKNLKAVPQFKVLAEKAKLVDILSGEGIAIDKYLKDKQITISLHTTSKGNFDFLFFVPITLRDNVVFRTALQNIITRNHAKVETRNYQGIEIQEVKLPNQKQLFSYAIYKGYFVGSFTAFLVEETIRNISELGHTNFYSVNKSAFSLEKPKEDAPYFYFNFLKLPSFLSIFYKDSLQKQSNISNNITNNNSYNDLKGLQNFVTNGYYVTEIDNKKITLKGLQNFSEKTELALFSEMKPTPCDLLPQFLPRKTSFLYRISFDNTQKFFKRNAELSNLSEDSLMNSNVLDFQEFSSYFEGEVALATLEAAANSEIPKVLYIKIKQPLELSRKLQNYAQELAKKANDTLLYENYANQKIIKLNYTQFPKRIFGILGNNFNGFPTSYFTFINNYLLIGNSPKALATVLEDVENEQVWAKIYHASPLLTQLEQPSTVCYVANVLRAWNFSTQQLNFNWQDFFEQNKRQFLRFEFLTLQYEVGEETVNSQLTLLHKPFEEANLAKNLRTMYETNFYNSLITKPFIVQNPNDKSKEVLVQDKGFHLHLLSVNGKKQWHFPVGSPIAKQVYQIDLQNQTQYLFASFNKIFLIDRNGKLVDGFPVQLKECGNIEFLSLLDYDKSKNYRISAADNNGNVFLLSKSGQILHGWNPKKLAGQLASPLAHIRTSSKDALLGLNKQGVINVLKRSGEMYKDFPLSVGNNLVSNYFVQQNTDFELTTLNILTTQGELIKLSLSGKVVGRENIERLNTYSFFKLLPDEVATNDYIFSRQDDNIIAIYNKNITLLFKKEFEEKNEKVERTIQYFNFGVNTEIVAITDKEAQKTHLYYLNGDAVCEPLESEQEVTIFFNETKNEFLIYSAFENKVAAKRIWKN